MLDIGAAVALRVGAAWVTVPWRPQMARRCACSASALALLFRTCFGLMPKQPLMCLLLSSSSVLRPPRLVLSCCRFCGVCGVRGGDAAVPTWLLLSSAVTLGVLGCSSSHRLPLAVDCTRRVLQEGPQEVFAVDSFDKAACSSLL